MISSCQQFIDAAVGTAADDPGCDVGEIGVRLDAVELGGFDERGDDGPMLRAAVGAGEAPFSIVTGDVDLDRRRANGDCAAFGAAMQPAALLR